MSTSAVSESRWRIDRAPSAVIDRGVDSFIDVLDEFVALFRCPGLLVAGLASVDLFKQRESH